MRARFILCIKPNGTKDKKPSYPGNAEIEDAILGWGWGSLNRKSTYPERLLDYQTMAKQLIGEKHFPKTDGRELKEIADENIVACDTLPDRSHLLLSRSSEGVLVVRIINPNLRNLQITTEKLLKDLRGRSGPLSPPEVENGGIDIFERAHEHVIMKGAISRNRLREIWKRHPVEILTVIFASVLSVLFFLVKQLEMLLPGMFSALVVTLITLIYRATELRKLGIIEWTAAGGSAVS
jgi:hypothetical protein